MKMTQVTPMLKQYLGIKQQYPDAIVFFRMGDFYEMFFEDAKIASKILGIALTSRGNLDGEKVPMCGVPHHASKSYIARLVAAGHKVAICEQMEDPALSKGIVKRDVVRIVTPGSVLEERDLEEKDSLYIAGLAKVSGQYGLAHVDLSTGEFRTTQVSEWDEVVDELARINPAELLVVDKSRILNSAELSEFLVEELDRDTYDPSNAEAILKEQFEAVSLASYGLEEMRAAVVAAGAVVAYLRDTQKNDLVHIKSIAPYRPGDFMFLDHATMTNLELFKTIRRQSEKGTLLSVLDKTKTPMGSRMLKKWIAYPLVNLDGINQRLSAVAELKENPFLREDVRAELDQIYDLERINGRIALNRATPKDLIALKDSVSRLPTIKARISEASSVLLASISECLDTLDDIYQLLDNSICEDAPAVTKDGGIIKEGYSEELDKLVKLAQGGKEWIANFAKQEQERSGIPNLKVGYNKVFGYYIEVSKSNLALVPSHYIRKQTLVGAERYVTQELKEMEEEIIQAEEKRISLELEIFEEVKNRIAHESQRIKKTAGLLAQLDVLSTLAEVADLYLYCRPEMDQTRALSIIEGRHPVIERMMKEEAFVPNDIVMDDTDQQVIIITGPNMAGKSTILRQVALITLMAQMGSFVPAAKATIGLVDRIFSRVGASDDISRGRSTFMVEMNETASILKNATPRSLVILDEIGRGTSTYDGLSIAWAVAEALHDLDDKGVRTLFATHYHELTELVASKQRVKNFNVAVKKWKGKIVFLRKLVPGATSHSYGIDVARLAGLPDPVINRAREILRNLENEEIDEAGRPRLARSGRNNSGEIVQLNLFGMQNEQLVKWVKDLDIARMTPLEALVLLDKMKRYVENEGQLEEK